jgi:hypothetical protein
MLPRTVRMKQVVRPMLRPPIVTFPKSPYPPVSAFSVHYKAKGVPISEQSNPSLSGDVIKTHDKVQLSTNRHQVIIGWRSIIATMFTLAAIYSVREDSEIDNALSQTPANNPQAAQVKEPEEKIMRQKFEEFHSQEIDKLIAAEQKVASIPFGRFLAQQYPLLRDGLLLCEEIKKYEHHPDEIKATKAVEITRQAASLCERLEIVHGNLDAYPVFLSGIIKRETEPCIGMCANLRKEFPEHAKRSGISQEKHR